MAVSEQWLSNYMAIKYVNTPRKLRVKSKKKGKLTVQMDELWSLVDHKNNKQWVWIAIDTKTREINGENTLLQLQTQFGEAALDLIGPLYQEKCIEF